MKNPEKTQVRRRGRGRAGSGRRRAHSAAEWQLPKNRKSKTGTLEQASGGVWGGGGRSLQIDGGRQQQGKRDQIRSGTLLKQVVRCPSPRTVAGGLTTALVVDRGLAQSPTVMGRQGQPLLQRGSQASYRQRLTPLSPAPRTAWTSSSPSPALASAPAGRGRIAQPPASSRAHVQKRRPLAGTKSRLASLAARSACFGSRLG